jgi:hypothetical protein
MEEQQAKGVTTAWFIVPNPHFRTRVSSTRLSAADRYGSHLLPCNLTSDNCRVSDCVVSCGLHCFLLRSTNSASSNRTSNSIHIGHEVLTPTLEVEEVYCSDNWQFLIPDNSILFCFSSSSFLHMTICVVCISQ